MNAYQPSELFSIYIDIDVHKSLEHLDRRNGGGIVTCSATINALPPSKGLETTVPRTTAIEMLTCCAYCELPGDEEGGGGSGVTGLAGVTGAVGAARTVGAGVFWVVIDVGNGRPCG